MNVKSVASGLILGTSMIALTVLSSSAWSMHHRYHHYHYYDCSGQGWHMVSKGCPIYPAATWQEYNSGVYTAPVGRDGFLLLR